LVTAKRGTPRRPVAAPAAPAAPLDVGQALMLDVLGQTPVMFHRVYVGITGSINAALWLSYAMERRADVIAAGMDPEPQPVWFSFTREQCEEGTGLTRHQQDTARRELRQRGIVLEQRRSTTEIAIDTRKLGQLLIEQSHAQWRDYMTPDAGAAKKGASS
jgi:hypothetical protein